MQLAQDEQLNLDTLLHYPLQLAELFLEHPEIISIPLLVTMTVVISLLWAEKIPSIPIHLHKFRLIIGDQKVREWQRSTVAKNIDITLGKSMAHRGELLAYLGQESMAKHAEHSLKPHIEEYVDDVMATDFSIVWENLPPLLKRHAYQRAVSGLPRFLDNLVDDISYYSDQLLDYQLLATELLEKNPLKLAPFFNSDRFYESHVLAQRGAIIGLFLSLPIMFFYGYATLATSHLNIESWSFKGLLIIFEALAVACTLYLTFYSIYAAYSPSSEANGLAFGDLFKRALRSPLIENRTKVVEAHAHLITYQIFKLNQVIRHLFKSSNTRITSRLIRKHLHPLIETFFTKVIIQLFFGLSGFLRLKKQATEKIALLADYPFEDRIFQLQASQRLSSLLQERLSVLSDTEIVSLTMPYILYLRTKTILCSGTTITTMVLIQLYILF